MSKESVMGFELAIDLISERLSRFKLCKADRETLQTFLGRREGAGSLSEPGHITPSA